MSTTNNELSTGILGALSPTRLVPLLHPAGWPVWLKLEMDTPSGSHKWRAASKAVSRLLRQGIIGHPALPSIMLVISSSGNAAYAVALLIAGTNARLVVFTDALSPHEMVDRLRSLSHVTVVVIDEPDETGSHVKARKLAVRTFLAEQPQAIEIDQYCQSEWGCGYFSLFREIEQQVGEVGAIIIPPGTGATLRAAVQYRLHHQRRWSLFAADAMGSALFGTPCGTRLWSGYGNGIETAWIRQVHPYVQPDRVRDDDVVRASRWLLAHGYFLGASSAAVFVTTSALIRARRLPHAGAIVLVMPDAGECYRSTLFSDDFLIQHNLGHLVAASAV
jgi:cysteine synthase A